MMTDLESASRAVVRITRAAPIFDQLVDALLSQIELSSDASRSADRAAGEAKFRTARERLDAHYPEFQRLYFELLHKHLGARLPAVLDALSNELVQAYFKAQEAMELELITELQRLAEKMASVVPVGSSELAAPYVEQGVAHPDRTPPRVDGAAARLNLNATLPMDGGVPLP